MLFESHLHTFRTGTTRPFFGQPRQLGHWDNIFYKNKIKLKAES